MDRPALKPFPETRYVFAEWRKATVNIDYHITVDHNLYSVPHSLIGRELDVRLTAKTVEVSGRGHRVAVHQRAFGRGRVTTELSHRPASHQRHLEWTPQRMIRQNRRLTRLLKAAKLRLPACVEDINYRQLRGLDRSLVVHLATCDWIGGSQNVLITGAYPGRLGNGTAESCGKPRHPGDHRRSHPAVIHDNCQPTPC
jgi:hypothetical protein